MKNDKSKKKSDIFLNNDGWKESPSRLEVHITFIVYCIMLGLFFYTIDYASDIYSRSLVRQTVREAIEIREDSKILDSERTELIERLKRKSSRYNNSISIESRKYDQDDIDLLDIDNLEEDHLNLL